LIGAPSILASSTDSSALTDAAALGGPALASVVAGARDGITIVDAERRFVYANPAACEMLGRPLEQLRGRDFMASVPARDHSIMLARFSEQLRDSAGRPQAPVTCNLRDPDGAEREIVYSTFAIEIEGDPHGVAVFQDLTGPRAAARAAVALTQTAAELVEAGTTPDRILEGIAHHAVEGTRALVCGMLTVDGDRNLASAGGYARGYDTPAARATSARWVALGNARGEAVIAAMADGSITIGAVPGKPVVLSDARAAWEADPLIKRFTATLRAVDWQAGVFVPLSWENRVFGLLTICLPSGLAGPSEAELAFYTALADQAAVALTNARLTSQARRAATSLERARLARELHDSVSQALFSMTMHARAAQLSMVQAGLDESGPLGRSIAELAELTRGALAEMRALIFELRPAALTEEGLVAALRKQAAALSSRERVVITVEGPEPRLELAGGVEEHLYRIASEALHNVVRHGGAGAASVCVHAEAGILRVEVRDDGTGFDQDSAHPGHLGLSTMAERAERIGAKLGVSSELGKGTTVVVSVPVDRKDPVKAEPVGGDRAATADIAAHDPQPSATERSAVSGGGGPAESKSSDARGGVLKDSIGPLALSDAAALGVPTLAGILAGAQEGITIADAERRFVYANPAACRLFDRPLEQLRGQDFLSVIPAQEQSFALGRFSERLGRTPGDATAPFSAILMDPDGAEREIVCSTFAAEMAGGHHGVSFLRDVTGTRAAARAAVALAQAASQLVGAGTTSEILAGIARHAVEGTRALACGLAVVDDDHKLSVAGGYGHGHGHGQGLPAVEQETMNAAPIAHSQAPADQVFARLRRHLDDADAASVIEVMTAGAIILAGVPGRPVVLPDARSVWAADPVTEPFVATLGALDWEAGVYVPLSWENRVIGVFAVYLPSGITGPSEAELAFYAALADQAAVAVINARLTAQASEAATSLERTRLARELHDSVSQALFSMTMHASAAQLSIRKAGLDEDGPLGRAIGELGELTRGAMAEMRALIFELRPGALAEEGVVEALRKQAAALTAREQVVIAVQGPEQRLDLPDGVEEHLYRIVSEALHNIVRHAHASAATVIVAAQARVLHVVVSDDGAGFDADTKHPGHLGLTTMAERAAAIGAEFSLTSAPGSGTTVSVSLPLGPAGHGKAGRGGR
jgi:PAS domain S-box-containing protein